VGFQWAFSGLSRYFHGLSRCFHSLSRCFHGLSRPFMAFHCTFMMLSCAFIGIESPDRRSLLSRFLSLVVNHNGSSKLFCILAMYKSWYIQISQHTYLTKYKYRYIHISLMRISLHTNLAIYRGMKSVQIDRNHRARVDAKSSEVNKRQNRQKVASK
jgi:hypothetical protein